MRFTGNDARMAAELKRLRHEISGAGELIAAADLLAARDTPADVGTNISTKREMDRADSWDVVTAALKRLEEALRVCFHLYESLAELAPEGSTTKRSE